MAKNIEGDYNSDFPFEEQFHNFTFTCCIGLKYPKGKEWEGPLFTLGNRI